MKDQTSTKEEFMSDDSNVLKLPIKDYTAATMYRLTMQARKNLGIPLDATREEVDAFHDERKKKQEAENKS